MRSTAARAGPAMAGSTVTSSFSMTRDSKNLRQRDPLHVRAEVAGTHEVDLRRLDRDVVAHRAFGHEQNLARLIVVHPFDHAAGRAGEIGFGDHVRRALGMGDDLHAWIGLAIGAKLLAGEALMHLAMALPGDDLDGGLGGDPLRQILVRDHDDAFGAEQLDHAHGVRRGAGDVGLGLHFGRGVDVGHHRHAGIGLAQRAHVGAGDGAGKRAAGSGVGDQHHLVRVEQLRGLGHEMHAALHDDIGIALGRLAGELERVADDVGNAMEDFRRHVVVGEHHGVARALQLVDGLDVRGEARPLDGRDHTGYALIEMRRLARHLWRVGEIGQRRRDQLPRRLKHPAARYGGNLRHSPYSRSSIL